MQLNRHLSPARSTKWSAQAGFTLLEVILAIGIAIGILLVALVYYQQAAHLRGQLLQESDQIAAVRLLMDRITSELRTTSNLAQLPQTMTGGSNFIEFVKTSVLSSAAWSGDALGGGGEGGADLKIVSYRLISSDPTNTAAGLTRSERPLLQNRQLASDSTNSMQLVESAVLPLYPIAEEVRFLRFRYWDGQLWLDSWNRPALPMGVEVSLGLELPSPADESEADPQLSQPEIFRRTVYLPASRIGNGTPSIAQTVPQPAEAKP